MNWIAAAAAPALVGAVLLATGRAPIAIVAYHILCGVLVWSRRRRVRSLLRRDPSTLRWALGTSALVLGVLSLAPLLVDPAPYGELYRRTLFPGGRTGLWFPLFAAYTLLVHAPLEELFWRAAVTDPDRVALPPALMGNAVFFGLLHAVPLGIVLGPEGVLFSIPTAAAGALWAFVTIRSRSLWPALVSHWGADAAILGGMWFFFVR